MADLELLKRPYLSALEMLGWGVIKDSGTTLTVEMADVVGHLTLDPREPSLLAVWVSLDIEDADPATAAEAAPATTRHAECVKVLTDGVSSHVLFTIEGLVSAPGLLPAASDLVWRLQGSLALLMSAVEHFLQDAMVLAGIELASAGPEGPEGPEGIEGSEAA